MGPTHTESAINTAGEAAIFVGPLTGAPTGASLCGRRVVVYGPVWNAAFRVAREVASAAKAKGWLLVIEVVAGRVVRETPVPIRGGV